MLGAVRAKTISRALFDGPAARIMARRLEHNRDAEAEAVEELDPRPADHVLVIGFGTGMGIELLVDRLPSGRVVGADLSKAMVKLATKRNSAAVARGRVKLVRAPAHELPFDHASFDGVITVNTIQLWDPFKESVAEVARVMRPGARLVSFTHDWAIERFRRTAVDEWATRLGKLCASHELVDARHWYGRAENGKIVAFVVRKTD